MAKTIKANHFNQTFSAVGWTRANVANVTSHINAMVSPSGTPGLLKVSTGPLSKECDEPALVPARTAISMIREMGGNSIKFFPMGGLKVRDELEAVAKACAAEHFCLEPTGGIDPENFREIMEIVLNAGVEQVIPHVYSSIIDKETGCTKIDEVENLMQIVKQLVSTTALSKRNLPDLHIASGRFFASQTNAKSQPHQAERHVERWMTTLRRHPPAS